MDNINQLNIWIDEIDSININDKASASLYYTKLCKALLQKYGNIDNDFPKSTKRGTEWLDIHHIDESELDNIAVRTNKAIKEKDTIMLEKLMPYNKANRLIYANKIEHFLIHYLIDIIRGEGVLSGGPNFCWDCAIALEYFTLKPAHLIVLQEQKDTIYNNYTLLAITKLYAKLIKHKKWNIDKIKPFWNTYNYCTFKSPEAENQFHELFKMLHSL